MTVFGDNRPVALLGALASGHGALAPMPLALTLTLTPALLDRLVTWCEAEPEREVCGLLLERDGALEAERLPNAADEERFRGASRTSYVMEARALLRALRRLDDEGGRLVAVWHSHVDAPATFSAADRAQALADDDTPLLGEVDHLVLGLRAGRVTETRCFRWDGSNYLEVPTELQRAADT